MSTEVYFHTVEEDSWYVTGNCHISTLTPPVADFFMKQGWMGRLSKAALTGLLRGLR